MNWLLQNFSNRARFALGNPLYVLNSLLREIALADERFLSSITNVPVRRIRGFIKEPFQNGSDSSLRTYSRSELNYKS